MNTEKNAIYKKIFNEDVSKPQINQDVMNADIRLAMAEILAMIIAYYHKDKKEIDIKVFAIVIFILMIINNENLTKGDKPRHLDMIAILLKAHFAKMNFGFEMDITEYCAEITNEVEKLYHEFFDNSDTKKLITNLFIRDIIFLLTNKETDKLINMFCDYLTEVNNILNILGGDNNGKH